MSSLPSLPSLQQQHGSFEDLPTYTITTIIFFGSVTFATVSMATKAWLAGDDRALRVANLASRNTYRKYTHPVNKTSSPTSQLIVPPLSISSFASVYTLLHHFTIIGLVIFTAYIFEYHPPFPNYNIYNNYYYSNSLSGGSSSISSNSNSDDDMFLFLILIFLICGYYTIRQNTCNDTNTNGATNGSMNNDQKVGEGNHNNSEARRKDKVDNDFVSSSSVSTNNNSYGYGGDDDNNVINMQDSSNNDSLSNNNNNNNKGISSGTTRRRVQSRRSSIDSIHSDELLSLLEENESSTKAESITSHQSQNNNNKSNRYHGGRLLGKTTLYPNKKNDDNRSSLLPSPTIDAEKILDEILLTDSGRGIGKGKGRSIIFNDGDDHDGTATTTTKSLSSSDSDALFDLPVISLSVDNDVLNVHQTLEMKGFMTICLLFYQFTNVSSYEAPSSSGVGEENNDGGDDSVANYYYNTSRLFVTAFLFLTGFGHAMFFYRKRDYSLNRLIEVLFRMNFSAMFLCLALGKPYIFYRACCIHTYFFLLIYFTMKWMWKIEDNYMGYRLRLKMALLAVILFLLWDCDYGLWSIHIVLFGSSRQPVDGAPYGQLWEFYFRGYLHHWASFFGMLFAANHPVTSLLMRKLEAIGPPSEIIFKSITGFLLLAATTIWALGPFDSSKYIYNATNPYFGLVPIMCVIFFRNINPMWRSHHIQIFKAIGVYSLEIYLLHYHLFLGEEGLAKKTLIPGYPTCNFLCAFCLVIALAIVLKNSTSVVTTMLTSHNGDKMNGIRNVITILGTLIIIHAITIILQFTQMIAPETIVTATIICGILLYQSVMDLTWTEEYVKGLPVIDSISLSSLQTSNTISPVSKTSPPIIGTIVILLLCLTWQIASMNGVNTSGILSPVCMTTLNEGEWVPIDSCSEFQQRRKSRDFYSRLSSTNCYEELQWGWTRNELTPQCPFHFFSPIEAQKQLYGKNLVFLGDTMTRNLFFAVCRVLGDEAAGSYDEEIPVHSDISKKFGSITVTFKWAPLVTDILTKLSDSQPSTDLIVAGSGARDKLHWVADEDQKSHMISLRRLSRQLQILKNKSVPTIWFTPTTINTQALPREEWRSQMSESSVQEMRQLYEKSGVHAAAGFVLEGHSFTATQSHQSYDGIHYPAKIYSVGAQIMMNSLNWLLPSVQLSGRIIDTSFEAKPGVMANQSLGLMVLGLISISLLFFDGFFGLFYIASIFVQSRKVPNRMSLFHTSIENKLRYSFLPSNIYAEFSRFMQKSTQTSRSNRGLFESSDGIS